jgi:post-segregation antitoxin (ccd killing protein)
MKRTNVVLDEELLERARRVLGEKTYSGTITKALEKAVRQDKFVEAYHRFAEEARKGDFFWPGYLEEIRPNAYAVLEMKKKQRVSADEKRVPRKSQRRGSR